MKAKTITSCENAFVTNILFAFAQKTFCLWKAPSRNGNQLYVMVKSQINTYYQHAERVILLTKEHKPINSQYRNMRIAYLIAIVITILLGLASRKWSHLLLSFVAQNAGDILWAMMVYFGFRLLLVRKNILPAIVLSFLFSFGIEFSQLYQEDWINHIRGTLLGALVLGKGFLVEDLIRYTAGIIMATVLDKVALKIVIPYFKL